MKLKPADIDRILEENIPKTHISSANDYVAENANARDQLVESLTSYTSQSSARVGEVLPLPPRTLRTQVDRSNDFGIKPSGDLDLEATAIGSHTVQGREVQVLEPVVMIPAALRGCDLSKIESRADLMAALTSNLPMNELNLPKIIYRSDLLDWKLFSGAVAEGEDPSERYKSMQEYLDMATVWLSYVEGFPALPSGEPLWAKMPFEVADHYSAFTSYCLMPGARQVAKVVGPPVDHVLQWFHEDYWAIRVKCYDMVHVVHAAKMREQRVLACEDDHYLQAENMFKKLQSMFSAVNWDALVDNPKEYVEVMERAVKMQRLSLGLSSMGNANGLREPKSETLEVTMRRIAEPNLPEARGGESMLDVKQLLRNPDALASAQELVIRMTRTEQTIDHDQAQ